MRAWLYKWGGITLVLWLIIEGSRLIPDSGGPDGDGDADDVAHYVNGHATYGSGGIHVEGLISVLGKVGAVLGTVLVLTVISLTCRAFGRWQEDRRSSGIRRGGASRGRGNSPDNDPEGVTQWPGLPSTHRLRSSSEREPG